MSKREGTFCDKRAPQSAVVCSKLAIGTCVTCDQDVCTEHAASFRGVEFQLEVRLHHGDVKQSYDVLHEADVNNVNARNLLRVSEKHNARAVDTDRDSSAPGEHPAHPCSINRKGARP